MVENEENAPVFFEILWFLTASERNSHLSVRQRADLEGRLVNYQILAADQPWLGVPFIFLGLGIPSIR